jgi:hypothetical protein
MLSDRQAIEVFHLHFLRLLVSGPQKGGNALKGGCNLRFFFGSVRYSEDMDLDIADLPVFASKDRMMRILEGPALNLALRARGIGVAAVSAPMQTETTQPWKIGLSLAGHKLPFHTKIGFSRRTAEEAAVTEAVDREVLAEYQLMPLLVLHYPLEAALRQKAGELAHRSVVQARDVLDLAVLFARAAASLARSRPCGRTCR